MAESLKEAEPGDEVGVIGLGPMGAPISERLIASQLPITVWNRTAAKAERFAERGATLARRPADAAAAVVLTILPDLPEVEAVLNGPDGLLAGWQERQTSEPVLVIHGTVSPVAVRAMAQDLYGRYRIHVIDAPLSGGTLGAKNGTLSLMGGGEQLIFTRLEWLFRRYASTIRFMGPSGSGAMAKVCNQVIVASTVAAVSEGVLLTRTSGLDLNALFTVLAGGLAGSEVIRQKSEKWINQDYSEGGSGTNQLKDLRFAHEAARELGLTLPLMEKCAEVFGRMISDGDGALDHTAVYRTISRNHWG